MTAKNLNTTTYPTIALVGRVNVGKSTLFNRLIEEPKAIVSKIPGTTRTSNKGVLSWRGKSYTVIDTGGLTFDTTLPYENEILEQTRRAIAAADIIFFLMDIETDILPQERAIAKVLRETTVPVIVVLNKATPKEMRNPEAFQSWRQFGFTDSAIVNALSGAGVGDLLDSAISLLPPTEISEKSTDQPIQVTLIGRPNVGKSTLFNALIGEEEVIVSPLPHTTREPYDRELEWHGHHFVFIDTAGIRRKKLITEPLEKIGIHKSVAAIRRADVVLLVLDANEPLSAQEKYLAGIIEETAKSVIIIVNKWDLTDSDVSLHKEEITKKLQSFFSFIRYAPVLFVSGKTHYRVHTIFPTIVEVARARTIQIPDEELETFLKEMVRVHLPSRGKGTRHPKILGIQQIAANPPVIRIDIQYRTSLHPSYVSFLENRLRERYTLIGTPLIMKLKKKRR